jgi:DNA-binding LacI/PurR family transcriptional regulator
VYLQMLKKEGEVLDPAVSPTWFQLFTGIASETEACGYTVSVIPDTGEVLSAQLHGRDLCGVLVPCQETGICEALLRDGVPEGMRCLFMGLPFGMPGLDYTDELGDSAVSRMIGEFLGRGYRRLAVLGTASPNYTNRAIWRGYRAAMEAAGAYSPRYEKPLSERSAAWEYEAAVRELLALPEPPEVLVVFRERFLDGVMAALSAAGARVPEDVSVALVEHVGNYPSSKAALVERVSGPRLPEKTEAGRVAVRRLLDLVEGRCEQVHEDGAWSWHEGETMAPPKGARRRSRQR